jgi:hypothetical protein
MHAKEIERAAYIAAHGILAADTGAPELACPGARRSHAVDVIADIIREVFELYDSECDTCGDRRRTKGLAEVVREGRRPALVLEVSRQAVWRAGSTHSGVVNATGD